jgi:hypothetical protein
MLNPLTTFHLHRAPAPLDTDGVADDWAFFPPRSATVGGTS